MNIAIDYIRDHGVQLVALLAVCEGILCFVLIRRTKRMHLRLDIAVAAAEDAARAAALAAPGGIDPEVVIQLLRSGRPTSLEVVYQVMEQQAAAEEAAIRLAARAPGTAGPMVPLSDQERSEIDRRLGRFT